MPNETPKRLRWSAVVLVVASLFLPWLKVSCSSQVKTATGLELIQGVDPGREITESHDTGAYIKASQELARPKWGLALTLGVILVVAILLATKAVSKVAALGLAAASMLPLAVLGWDVMQLKNAARDLMVVDFESGFWLCTVALTLFILGVWKEPGGQP
jgi:hypothetical protein